MNDNKKQKLELTWIGKGKEIKIEPRILIEDQKKSYGDPKSENMLIHGDNLLALKALEQDFAGKVKCIYIDPPYNTGNAFEQYDDNIEHSIWLNLISPRLEIFKHLLHTELGSIWISIDDDESHYLKILCDEIFGRKNFVANVVWQKKYGPANDAKWLSDSHDHILIYARNKLSWRPNLLPRTEEQLKDFKNPDNDPRGLWRASDLSVKTPSESCIYPIKGPTGITFMPPPTRSWVVSKERFEELLVENRIWWGVNKSVRPMVKKFLSEVKEGITPETWWPREFAADNKIAKYESKTLFVNESFATPKPELLLSRIIHIATNKNDWMLDSFLGSGTTSAVAHKMGRKWIGIEMGDHANTHCLPRLKKVVDGKDGLELSEKLGWEGGGGFKFYNLAPSLLRKDKFDNWVIDEKYNANMLAVAMCKHEGFQFSPDSEIYWKQGKSTETDFIFVTTSFVTVEQLDKIREEMKKGESLLVCAKSFAPQCKERHSSITIKKIPQMVLNKCEFGKDNYDLNIVNGPKAVEEELDDISEEESETTPKQKNESSKKTKERELF